MGAYMQVKYSLSSTTSSLGSPMQLVRLYLHKCAGWKRQRTSLFAKTSGNNCECIFRHLLNIFMLMTSKPRARCRALGIRTILGSWGPPFNYSCWLYCMPARSRADADSWSSGLDHLFNERCTYSLLYFTYISLRSFLVKFVTTENEEIEFPDNLQLQDVI